MLWLLSELVTVKIFLPESCLPCCSKKHWVCQLLNEIRWVPGCPHIQHSQNTLMRVSVSHLFSRSTMPFTKNWAYYNKNRCIIKVLGDHMHMTAPLQCYKHSKKANKLLSLASPLIEVALPAHLLCMWGHCFCRVVFAVFCSTAITCVHAHTCAHKVHTFEHRK